MTAEPTGLFQGTGASTRQSDGHHDRCGGRQRAPYSQRGPEEVKDDESDALATALCITASPEDLDRDSAAQLREFTDVAREAATNMQQVKDELAAAEKVEREAADERRAKKAKGKVVPPAVGADVKPETVKPAESGQTSLGLFDQGNEPEEALTANAADTVKPVLVTVAANDYPD